MKGEEMVTIIGLLGFLALTGALTATVTGLMWNT